MFYWTPCIDGNFIQESPYSLFEQGKFVKVPIIFGDDTNEGSYFAYNAETPADLATFFVANYPNLTTADTNGIIAQYPLEPPVPDHNPWFPSTSAAYGENTFTCPGILISQTHTQYSSPYTVWNYRYNVLSETNEEEGLGVPHTFESEAIFGVNYGGSDDPSYTSYDAEMVPVVMDYWISFVRGLSPNRYKDAGSPQWEAYTGAQRRLVLQPNATAMEAVPGDQLGRCAFWKSLAGVMEQ